MIDSLENENLAARTKLWVTLGCTLVVALLGLFFVHEFRRGEEAAPSLNSATSGLALPTGKTDRAPGSLQANGAAEPLRAPQFPPGQNAADFYKEAMSLYNALSEEDRKLLRDWHAKVSPEKEAELFREIAPIMALLKRGQDSATYCDWGMGPFKFDTRVPQLTPLNNLCGLSRWSAAHRIGTDPDAAIDDLALGIRTVESGGPAALIGFLLNTSAEKGAIEVLQANVGLLSQTASDSALAWLKRNDPAASLAASMTGELQIQGEFLTSIADPKTRARFVEQARTIVDAGADALENNPDSVMDTMKWAGSVQTDFASKAVLPDADFQAWWSGVQSQAASHPFGEMILSYLPDIRNRMREEQVQINMLSAGLTILRSGPDQLAAFHDPTTGTTFTYTQPADGGFTLSSPFAVKNKPVTMTFPGLPKQN